MAVYMIAVEVSVFTKSHELCERKAEIATEINVPEGSDPETIARESVERYNKKLYSKHPKYFYQQRRFLNVVSKCSGAGIDKYGKFYSFTGNEGRRKCFWCGADVKKGNKRYCSDDHKVQYLNHFWWPYARDFCRSRHWDKNKVSYLCGDCNRLITLSKSRVHHIQRLPNSDPMTRQWNALNCPENLILLCTACHGLRHRAVLPEASGQLLLDLLTELN